MKQLPNPSSPVHGFTRLDDLHLRHDETGLIILHDERKIVDPTGKKYQRQQKGLCHCLSGHLGVYHALKSKEVPGNWLTVADSELFNALKTSIYFICPYCLLFCTTTTNSPLYYKHLNDAHGIDNTTRPKMAVKRSGCCFYGGVKQSSYFILREVNLMKTVASIAQKFHDIEKEQREKIAGMDFTTCDPEVVTSRLTRDELKSIHERVLQSLKKGSIAYREKREEDISREIQDHDYDQSSDEEPEPKTPPPISAYSAPKVGSDPPTSQSQTLAQIDSPNTSFPTYTPSKRQTTPQTNLELLIQALAKNQPTEEEILMKFMLDDVDSYIFELIGATTPDFEKTMLEKEPELMKVVHCYFTDASTRTHILPVVLLDCITDDLSDQIAGISEKFKFVLNSFTPELVITSPNMDSFQLALRVAENDERDWDACITWRREGEDANTSQCDMRGLTFFHICEVLVTFRAIVYTLGTYFGKGGKLPDRELVKHFIRKCLREHRCGTDKSALIVYESLFNHVTKWK